MKDSENHQGLAEGEDTQGNNNNKMILYLSLQAEDGSSVGYGTQTRFQRTFFYSSIMIRVFFGESSFSKLFLAVLPSGYLSHSKYWSEYHCATIHATQREAVSISVGLAQAPALLPSLRSPAALVFTEGLQARLAVKSMLLLCWGTAERIWQGSPLPLCLFLTLSLSLSVGLAFFPFHPCRTQEAFDGR